MINYSSWTKSSRSENAGNCIELKRRTTETTAIRDSKVDDGPRVEISNSALAAFVGASAEGCFG